MDITVDSIITLENDEKYIVIDKIMYQNINYYFIVDINDEKNFKFCYIENDELVETKNDNLIGVLMLLISKKEISNE